jgi:hypothetical protein
VAAAAARERTGCCWSSSSCYQSKQGPRRPQAGTERYQNIISEMASKYSLNIVKTVAEMWSKLYQISCKKKLKFNSIPDICKLTGPNLSKNIFNVMI